MSELKPFKKIALIRSTSLKMTPVLKYVLLVIASHMGKNNFCHISIRTLMKECEISATKQFYKYLRLLEKNNLLAIIPPSDGFKSNRFYINFELILRINAGKCSPLGRTEGLFSSRGRTQCSPFDEKCSPLGGESIEVLSTEKKLKGKKSYSQGENENLNSTLTAAQQMNDIANTIQDVKLREVMKKMSSRLKN